MRLPALIMCLLMPAYAMSQDYERPLGKGKINNNICMRAELGWNKSWFASLGASYVYSNVNSHSPFFTVLYAAGEVDVRTYGPATPFYAYKAGFECGSMLLGFGGELRNSTDFVNNNHLVFMGKAGLSLFGHASLYYGYNFFRAENNVFGIGHSQLSLSVSLNRKVLKESLVPKH